MMRKYIITLILLYVGIASGWAVNEQSKETKLPQEIISMQHDTLRLQKLNELVNQTINEPKVYSFYLNELLKEAELQKNNEYIAKSYLLYLYLNYNEYDSKMVKHWMSKLEPLARKEGFYNYLFEAQQCIIDGHILKQEFELAEQKSKRMLAEAQKLKHIDGIVTANKCLASVYRSTYRFDKSAEMLEAAYKLASQMTNAQNRLEVITYLISIYKYTGNHSKWLKYLNIKEKEIKKLIDKEPKQIDYYKGDLMLTYLSYLEYYIEKNQKDQAEYYKQLVDEYKCDEYVVYQFNYFKGIADYYQFTKQWEKALEYRTKQCDLIKTLSYRDYPYILLAKAELFYLMGREKDALETAKEVLRVKNEVQVSIFSKQIEQIKSNYITSQDLLEQAHIHRYYQYTILGVVTILIITFSYFAYRYYYIKRNLTKSENKIRQVAEEVQRATRAKASFLSNMSYAIRIPLNEVVNRSLLLASKQKINEEERAKVAQAILDTSSDLMKLVEEILDLSRLEAGRMKFSVSDIDVNALVRDAVSSFTTSDVELITSFPESQNIYTHIDGTRLMQVFNSLLTDIDKGKKMCVELKEEPNNILLIRVTHTTFASSEPTQDIIIRNEINRMIIEYFEGDYQIVPDAIQFSLKIVHSL